MFQKPLSIFTLIYKALTRKPLPLYEFNELDDSLHEIRFKQISTPFSLIMKFHKAFADPNHIPSFMFVACYRLLVQLIVQLSIPSKLNGLIHLSSDFTLYSDHNWHEPYDATVAITDVEESDLGIVYTLVTTLSQNDQKTWQNENKILDKKRTYRAKDSAKKIPSVGTEAMVMKKISHTTAWHYASLSGDFNPIHLSPFTAKLFGLKRAIIHGMFNAHFVLSELHKQEMLHHQQVNIAFNKPCFIPTDVYLHKINPRKFVLYNHNASERYMKLSLK